jgi:hypothetical protein
VVRLTLPENLPAGPSSTSHRPISRSTPQTATKLREKLGYLLGNLYLKGIEPNCSQSRGIEDFSSLGQELKQLEKPPNRVRFKGDFGGKVTSQRGTKSSYMTPNKIPKKSSSNSAEKITTRSSENHHKEGQKMHHTTLRNHVETSIHTMKVHTRSSLPPIHPSLSIDLTLSSHASPRKN